MAEPQFRYIKYRCPDCKTINEKLTDEHAYNPQFPVECIIDYRCVPCMKKKIGTGSRLIAVTETVKPNRVFGKVVAPDVGSRADK